MKKICIALLPWLLVSCYSSEEVVPSYETNTLSWKGAGPIAVGATVWLTVEECNPSTSCYVTYPADTEGAVSSNTSIVDASVECGVAGLSAPCMVKVVAKAPGTAHVTVRTRSITRDIPVEVRAPAKLSLRYNDRRLNQRESSTWLSDQYFVEGPMLTGLYGSDHYHYYGIVGQDVLAVWLYDDAGERLLGALPLEKIDQCTTTGELKTNSFIQLSKISSPFCVIEIREPISDLSAKLETEYDRGYTLHWNQGTEEGTEFATGSVSTLAIKHCSRANPSSCGNTGISSKVQVSSSNPDVLAVNILFENQEYSLRATAKSAGTAEITVLVYEWDGDYFGRARFNVEVQDPAKLSLRYNTMEGDLWGGANAWYLEKYYVEGPIPVKWFAEGIYNYFKKNEDQLKVWVFGSNNNRLRGQLPLTQVDTCSVQPASLKTNAQIRMTTFKTDTCMIDLVHAASGLHATLQATPQNGSSSGRIASVEEKAEPVSDQSENIEVELPRSQASPSIAAEKINLKKEYFQSHFREWRRIFNSDQAVSSEYIAEETRLFFFMFPDGKVPATWLVF